jgi:hypothetical protein
VKILTHSEIKWQQSRNQSTHNIIMAAAAAAAASAEDFSDHFATFIIGLFSSFVSFSFR